MTESAFEVAYVLIAKGGELTLIRGLERVTNCLIIPKEALDMHLTPADHGGRARDFCVCGFRRNRDCEENAGK